MLTSARHRPAHRNSRGTSRRPAILKPTARAAGAGSTLHAHRLALQCAIFAPEARSSLRIARASGAINRQTTASA